MIATATIAPLLMVRPSGGALLIGIIVVLILSPLGLWGARRGFAAAAEGTRTARTLRSPAGTLALTAFALVVVAVFAVLLSPVVIVVAVVVYAITALAALVYFRLRA